MSIITIKNIMKKIFLILLVFKDKKIRN